MRRRGALAAAAASFAAASARAAWPDGPVRLVVAYPAGGGTDIMARALGQKLSGIIGRPIVVENRSGAGGTVGTQSVAQARPDGYTLLFANGGEFALKPLVHNDLPYDTDRDFDLVAMCGITPVVIAVNARVPARSLQDFLALARARPGRLNVANSGSRSVMHLGAIYLERRAQVEFSHVPYRGAAPAVSDAAAGTVEAVVMGLPPILAQAREGRLRILGIMTPTRSSTIPDVPTLEELGFPGFDLSNSVGIVVPRGTPREIVRTLNEATARAMSDADVRAIFVANGAEPLSFSVEDYVGFVRGERERMREVVRVTGIPAD
jgi:tripartite-type tricarboxylate transporter receptor subunit TctC